MSKKTLKDIIDEEGTWSKVLQKDRKRITPEFHIKRFAYVLARRRKDQERRQNEN